MNNNYQTIPLLARLSVQIFVQSRMRIVLMLILCNVLSVKVEAQGRFHKTVSTDRNGDGSMYGAMVGTSDGGFVLACNKQGKSGGITNIFLAKLDASSNIVWNRSIGGPYVEFAT